MNTRALLVVGVLAAMACSESEPQLTTRELITIRTLGSAYLEENNLAAAEVEFLKLTEFAPDEPLGFHNLGLVYLRQGLYSQAEDRLAARAIWRPTTWIFG